VDQWSGWALGIGKDGVVLGRYAFGKVSSVSLVGGGPVGVGNDIVTAGAVCCDENVAMFTVFVNWINIYYSKYPRRYIL